MQHMTILRKKSYFGKSPYFYCKQWPISAIMLCITNAQIKLSPQKTLT